LLLLARGWAAPGFLLLALQAIPPYWPALWAGKDTVLATLALTLYFYILAAHWLVLVLVAGRQDAGRKPRASVRSRESLRDPDPPR